ncbi:MAG TPA: glycosyltransferase family 4 protein [Usitatibacter sp.]|nr:glycosyltransferase family 4 protein [Usitatibacter sp.]
MSARKPLEAETIPVAPDAAPKPHVCFLAPTAWPTLANDSKPRVVGGAELQQALIAKALVARGYRVSMVSMNYGQVEGTEAHGVRIYNMCTPDEGIPVVRFVHPRLTSLWQALKRVDADVYYQRTAASTTGFLAAFGKFHGKRCVYAGASDVDFMPKKQEIAYSRDRLLFEYGLRRVDRVIVQNNNQLKLLRENYGREGILIPNCYEAPAGACADRQGYILWVATMRASKRTHLVLEAARRLPQHKFVIVGGPEPSRAGAERFEALREAARAIPNVEFLGHVPLDETERLFNGARAFLNTSAYEGFPNTFLQAYSRGIPVVGMCDIGLDGKNGPVYDYEPELDGAVAAVDRLMSDDLHWQQHSQKVLAHHRETHSVASVVDEYEREFLHLARKP